MYDNQLYYLLFFLIYLSFIRFTKERVSYRLSKDSLESEPGVIFS